MSDRGPPTRTISTDPGLLSPEELLRSHKNGRRRTLEEIIAKRNFLHLNEPKPQRFLQKCREYIRWFLDSARLKISVSIQLLSNYDYRLPEALYS